MRQKEAVLSPTVPMVIRCCHHYTDPGRPATAARQQQRSAPPARTVAASRGSTGRGATQADADRGKAEHAARDAIAAVRCSRLGDRSTALPSCHGRPTRPAPLHTAPLEGDTARARAPASLGTTCAYPGYPRGAGPASSVV